MIHYDISRGFGVTDYRFKSESEAIKTLQANGFHNANFKNNLRGGNKFTRKIRTMFSPGYHVLQHKNGTLAFVGYEVIHNQYLSSLGPAQAKLLVRIIGKKEIASRVNR